MIVSGVLSLAGLLGVALADMNIRNIGIVGYAGVSMGDSPDNVSQNFRGCTTPLSPESGLSNQKTFRLWCDSSNVSLL